MAALSALPSTSSGSLRYVSEAVIHTSAGTPLPKRDPMDAAAASTRTPPCATTTPTEAPDAARATSTAIHELRRLSGLNWEQLAKLFDVSRRSVHFWASGKPMTPSHEEHLQRVLGVVRALDRGAASENRSLLLASTEDGRIPLDLLAAHEYDGVVARVGQGRGRAPAPTAQLSAEARAARAPRPPAELAFALQDAIHVPTGRVRAAKSVKVRRGER